ncbi:MAG: hypothetical protein LQ339_003287 [Xanthoria mediterranea]|nr:MAG: hypothetical protein LQ339_003287 [Xanthoria mediterranea]
MVPLTKDKGDLALEKLARDTKLAARRPNMEISVPKAASMVKALKKVKAKPKGKKALVDYNNAVLCLSSVQKSTVDHKKAKVAQKQREERLGPVKTGEAKSQAFQKWLDESLAQSNAWQQKHNAKYRK